MNANAKQTDLREMADKISAMKRAAEDLERMGKAFPFPAVARNAARILASLKMLEIDLSDALDLDRS